MNYDRQILFYGNIDYTAKVIFLPPIKVGCRLPSLKTSYQILHMKVETC